jgi:hypothetical protein
MREGLLTDEIGSRKSTSESSWKHECSKLIFGIWIHGRTRPRQHGGSWTSSSQLLQTIATRVQQYVKRQLLGQVTAVKKAAGWALARGRRRRRFARRGGILCLQYSHPIIRQLNEDAAEWSFNRTGDLEDLWSHNRYNRIQHHIKRLPLWQRGFLSLGKYRSST